jgi:hypothetical protein
MSTKLKIIAAVAAGVVVIALGAGAIVMAADNTTPTTTTTVTQSNTLFTKVAATLGVTEAQLTDAFKQANTQAESQRIDQTLAQAVTKGTITQAEADAIKAWLAQKPAAATKDELKAWQDKQPKVANNNALRGILGFGGGMMGPMMGGDTGNTDLMTLVVAALNKSAGKNITLAQLQAAFTTAQGQLKTDALAKTLADAVTSGKLTQAEADQIQSWWGSRPAALDKLAPNNGFCIPGIGGGKGGMMPGFNGPMGGRGFNRDGKTPATTPSTPKGPTT